MDDIREVAWAGNLAVLRQMVENVGMNVNDRHKMNGTTPLHWAVKGGYSNVISYLISKGADVNAKDSNGVTPLDLGEKSANSVRAVLGLPLRDSDPVVESRDANGMVASTAFVPLPPTPTPLAPLQPVTSTANQAPQQVSVPAPIAAASQVAVPTQKVLIPAVSDVSSTICMIMGDSEDGIEVDLPIRNFKELVYIIYTEFQLSPKSDKIVKIRKVLASKPHILVRNDKDIGRLRPRDLLQIFVESAGPAPSTD